MSLLRELDAHFGFSCEKIPTKGEDSQCEGFCETAGVMGVFDGCGGLGAATYPKLEGKTGAYLASRAAAGAVMDWFSYRQQQNHYDLSDLKPRILNALSRCVQEAEAVESKFRGSMVRLMPTTAALWFLEPRQGKLRAVSVSAGDSRNYILCAQGLLQISVDDLKGEDAMSNLYNDGAMTNVISADGRFSLRQLGYILDYQKSPCVLISATDGCFGYLPSPMDFELLLLDTLMQADSIQNWQERLMESIGAVAGDDYSLSAAAFGFGSFRQMKSILAPRHRQVTAVMEAVGTSTKNRWLVWDRYKQNYYRLAEGGIPERV